MGNSFKLDDLLRDDDGVKPPQVKKGAAGDGYALDDLLGPDSTTAPPAAPKPSGDVDLRSNTTTAPAPAPAPRRGIMQRIGDVLTRAVTPSASTAAAFTQSAQGQAPIAQVYKDAEETRRPVAIPDRTTPEQKNAGVRRKYEATVRQRPDQTGVLPAGSIQSHVDQARTIKGNSEESALRARFSPKAWREIAVKGMELANQLHAEGKHDEAEDANKKAYNAQLLADGAEQADTNGAIALSSLLGIVSDPYAAQKRNQNEIEGKQATFTPEEQQHDLGMQDGVPMRRGFDATKDLAIPGVASLPVYVAGGMAGRAMLGGVEALAGEAFPRVRSIAQALSAEAETSGLAAGEAHEAGWAGVKQAGRNFVENVPTLVKRGAAQGQVIGAVQAAREAQQTGGDPAEAAVSAVLTGVPLGVIGELAGGIASRLGGVASRTHLGRTHMGGLDVPRSMSLDELTPEYQPVKSAIETAREIEGKTRLEDQTREGQHATIAKALAKVLDQKVASEPVGAEVRPDMPPAGRAWWESNAPEHEPMVEPGSALRTREENPPLRSALDVANERAPTARDESNAVVKLERARAEEALVRENEARMADDARIEAAAAQSTREKQGPLTVSQTILRAGKDAEAGDPLAADYKEAINNHVDALARVQDAGEKGPTIRDRIALARSKVKLDEFRKKYGMQTGAAALVALASQSDDLTDDEKKWVGVAGIMGTTAMVPHGLPHHIQRALSALEVAERSMTEHSVFAERGGTIQSWEHHLEQAGLPRHEAQGVGSALLDAHGSDAVISGEQVRAALNDPQHHYPEPVAPPLSRGFVSRLRTAVETLQGKAWDSPRPAADWIGKLKGTNTFSKAELERIMPMLEQAQASKEKLDRAAVLALVNEHSPQIERHTLTAAESSKRGVELQDDNEIVDMHDLEGEPREVIAEQIAARQRRVTEIESEIESETERAADNMRMTEGNLSDVRKRLENELTEGFPDADMRGLDEVIDFINQHVEGEYIPRDTVSKAMDKLVEEAGLYPSSEPRDHEAQGVSVEESVGEDGEPLFTATYQHHSYEGGTQLEALARAEQAGEYESGSSEPLLPYDFKVVKEVDEEGTVEYVLQRSDGREIARGTDREQMIRDEVESNFDPMMNDDALGYVKGEIENYANALSEYNTAESEHYWMAEGEAHDELRREIDTHNEEISELETLHDQAHAEGDARQLDAGDAPTDPALAPFRPKVHGKPKFSSYQRIGGGTNYRELLNVWENNPGNAYARNHYRDTPNTAGHVRVEDHVLDNAPGLDDLHTPDAIARDAEPATDGTSRGTAAADVAQHNAEEARVARNGIRRVREYRETMQRQLDDIARQYEAMPADTRDASPEAAALAQQYEAINTKLSTHANEETYLLQKLREATGVAEPRKKIAVMIESQSDWAQDAGHHGVERAMSPQERADLSAKLDTVQAHEDGATEVRRAAEERAREINREYHAAFGEWARSDEGQVSEHAIPSSARDLVPGVDSGHVTLDELRTLNPTLAEIAERHNAAFKEVIEATQQEQRLARESEDLQRQLGLGGSSGSKPVPASPYTETKAAFGLNAARFLIDSAERGFETIGWSDAGNRVRNAHLPISAATLVYDQLTPSIMRSLLGGLGFKKVPIEKVYIRGNGHWKIDFTPEMRAAIRKNGLPVLGVLAAMSVPDDAQAQDGTTTGGAKLYATALGGIAAGALLMKMHGNRKLRGMVKENRELSRALMMDDLSGLSNKRALSRAIESVDRDKNTAWLAFDGDKFKALNDAHGHPEGDKAIQHFGATIRDVAQKLDVPMRGFRAGGDEFAFAVPKERAAEVMKAIEDASGYTKGEVTTKLTGSIGDTFGEADAQLVSLKNARRTADPSLRRADDSETVWADLREATQRARERRIKKYGEMPDEAADRLIDETKHRPLDFYANPVGPALRLLKRYPSAAGIIAVGEAMRRDDDDPMIQRAGVPVMALGALSAIGSHRLYAGADWLGTKLVDQLRKGEGGTKAVRMFNPDALLTPEVRDAIREFERGQAKGKARAAEFSGKAKALGPEGDRAVSDVLDNEDWEGAAKQTADVLSVATELATEYERLTAGEVAAGTLDKKRVLPNYGGPRKYAFYDAQDALADTPSAGSRQPGRNPKIVGTKRRTLDIPIREAEAKLAIAQATGDPAKITAAQDAVDQAKLVQMGQRVERGEIREASYRAAAGIEKAHANIASAKLFETLRNSPGTVHPEWAAAIDDLLAAKDMFANATTQADRDVAETLQHEAAAKIDEVSRRFKQRDGDYVSLPNTPSMGKLRGAVVQRDVAHSLEGFNAPQAYGKMLRSWKEIKTVFNVGTHIGNVLSNVTALHMGEVPVWLQPYYYKQAFSDLKGYGEATRTLAEAGVLNVNAVTALSEGTVGRGMRTREGLEELLPTTRPETQKVLRDNGITEVGAAKREIRRRVKGAAIGGALGAAKMYDPDHPEDAIGGAVVGAAAGAVFHSKRADRLRAIYGHEDNIARIAVFLRRRKLGDTIEQAREAAVNSLGDFRSRSPALRVISSTVSPFVMYQAKAVPAFARNVVDHPWKYLSLMAAWGAMDALGKDEMGEVPESDIPLNQRKGLGYFFPGFTQLPFGDERGNKAATDMARWTPMSGLTTGAPPGSIPEAFGDNGMQLVTPGGPVIDAALQASNVDPYTKGPLIKRDRPVRENVGALLGKAADFALPSSLGFHTTRLMDDMDNEDWTKFKNDLLGPMGAKPRYVRPGAVAQDAEFTLERSLRDMKQELKQRLRANKNEERVPELTKKYMRDVAQAMVNFRERVGVAPSSEIVHEYLPSEP